MSQRKIINEAKIQFPLYQAILYGNRVLSTKFFKRLACGIKHLPLRLEVTFEYDLLKSVDHGISTDPTLVLDGEVFIEGLLQTEAITEIFEHKLLIKKD